MKGNQSVDLRAFYREVFGLHSPDTIERAVAATRVITLKKRQLLARAGQKQKNLYLLVSGLSRIYRTEDGGEEVTVCIENHRGAPLNVASDMCPDTVTEYNIMALTEMCALAIPLDLLNQWVKTDPEVAALYQQKLLYWTDWALRKWNQTIQSDAEGRLRWFCSEYPGLLETMNNRYIASYLGITPVTLSRLRNSAEWKQKEGSPQSRKNGGGVNHETALGY